MTILKQKFLKKDPLIIGITVLLVIGLPLAVFFSSQTTNFFSKAAEIGAIEAENGIISNNVTVVDDTNASGGKYIRLGSVGTVAPTTEPVISNAEPTKTVEEIPTEFPSATNTGWQHTGVSLTNKSATTIRTDNTVIDGWNVSGDLSIEANNVTVKRSKVGNRLLIDGTNVLVEDSEATFLSVRSASNDVTIRRANIHGSGDGMNIGGNSVIVENSYIHDLSHKEGDHNDGLQLIVWSDPKPDKIIIRNNTIVNPYNQTSAILAGTGSKEVLIEGNLLMVPGGAFAIYCHSWDCTVRNNLIQLKVGSGAFASHTTYKDVMAHIYNNYNYDTGAKLPEFHVQ